MYQAARIDSAVGIEPLPIGARPKFRNLDAPRLYEEALRRGEGRIAKGGALVVETGPHTGRSPMDKFIVRDAATDASVLWDSNREMTPAHFSRLYADMCEHAARLDLFSQELYGGADPACRLKIRVYTEYAWHSLFIRNLLIRPSADELRDFLPDFTILDLPSFKADPDRHGVRSQTVIAIDVTSRTALICGTAYAGEIKKAVFTYLNFLLPISGILPMHCAANFDERGVALFFGLSGTGKTTLSADRSRSLIGDDEHGWCERGIFNFEGGCYAKAIRLSREAEPEIFSATERFGAVLENVSVDPTTRIPNFNDDARTENTRIAYPLEFIANSSATGQAGHPNSIIMLTCDAFGVLPPISKLDPAQAMYHFLSGYTAKVAGTEKGVREPQATFSTCFGAPFMPRHPSEYGNLLRDLISRRKVECWLVNTGWSGGAFGTGARMPIHVTRSLVRAALDGSLSLANFRKNPYFGLWTPCSAPGVDPGILNPESSWSSKKALDETARKLAGMFHDNFKKYEPFVERDVLSAGPLHP